MSSRDHLLSPSSACGALLAWIVASRLSKRRDISSTVVPQISHWTFSTVANPPERKARRGSKDGVRVNRTFPYQLGRYVAEFGLQLRKEVVDYCY